MRKMTRFFIPLCVFTLSFFYGWAAGIPQTVQNDEAIRHAKSLPQKGVLQIKRGYIYLKVDDGYIHKVFPLLNENNLQIPPYFRGESSVGAHISVVYANERKELPSTITEIGTTFDFSVKGLYSLFLRDHKQIYFITVDAPKLEAFRRRYGLSNKLLGHEFHITIATKCYPENQVIMKELRYWYNEKWIEYQKRHNPFGTWGNKPYTQAKGLSDDYVHLNRKDLRKWWNTRKPGFYAPYEGFEDDNVPVTYEFLEKWFHAASPTGNAP